MFPDHFPDDISDGPRGRSPRGRGRGRRGFGGGPRADRGDIRAAILALLAEQPMHGYQVMQELAERTGGAWRPSPGSIYPSLQQLADEGLVVSNDHEGRKVFELTDAGRRVVAEADTDTPPWERIAALSGSVDLRQAIFSLGGAAKQVATTGTPAQLKKAEEILVEARKRLYQLLAE